MNTNQRQSDPRVPLPTISLTTLNNALNALPAATPTIIRNSLTWLRDTLHPMHRLENSDHLFDHHPQSELAGEDPEGYVSALSDDDAKRGEMERMGVPVLADGGMGASIMGLAPSPSSSKTARPSPSAAPPSPLARLQSGKGKSLDEKSEKQRDEDTGRQYRKDRQRVRQVKKMLEMGQSSLFMPPAGSQHENGGSRRKRGLGEEYVLTGSLLVVPSKTKLEEGEKEVVARRLDEAMEGNTFKVWPSFRENTTKAEKREESEKNESPEFRVAGGGRRQDIKEMWDNKKERSIEGRRRVEGGYEDVTEAEYLMDHEMFGPTLAEVDLKKYQEARDAGLDHYEASDKSRKTTRLASRTKHNSKARTKRNAGPRSRNTKSKTMNTKHRESEDKRDDDSSSEETLLRRIAVTRRPTLGNSGNSSDEMPFAPRPAKP